MPSVALKQAIEAALTAFPERPLADAATALFASLGYASKKRLKLSPNTRDQFLAHFAQGKTLNDKFALPGEWNSIDFLFQLTDDEIRAAGPQQFLFASKGAYNGAAIESYLFFALDLKGGHYTRTTLAGITRELNKLFAMPALVLFRHADTLTLAVIDRRLHKRDAAKDVLEKVTLIKDIRCAAPHRAHVEILADLSFDALREKHGFTNFVELHRAWQKTLDSSELNKRFFLEIANWYFWALKHIEFPKDAPKEADGHDHISVIRLITRLIFCWFIKEKGLLPDALFDPRKLPHALNGFAPDDPRDTASVFYRAILQNLFFATLNTEMDQRGWTKEEQNFMAHSLYRSRDSFRDPAHALDLFKNIPFLNGGLFECLDRTEGTPEKPRYVRIDGFSRRADSQPVVPDFLFFGPEREVDLSADYGEAKFKRVKVRGLIHTFDHYKFTVTENTPIEEEIALDPELSGKVFENLLAAYNPETGATARKSTGSFYTPREIVDYMVAEALIACLKTKLEGAAPSAPQISPLSRGVAEGRGVSPASDIEAKLRHLFAYNDEPHRFSAPEIDLLIRAIDRLKSLDPAVGSGAFPMGILHKLVFILGRLDPRNEKWKERQLARVREAMAAAEKIEDAAIRERTLRDLEQQIAAVDDAFARNELDYGRKLYLIENCIYGVDLQPIAVQIAKMRFFISLIVDQKVDPAAPNLGVRPLPNLETKFVAANTLVGVEKRLVQFELGADTGEAVLEIDRCKAELARVRHEYFNARTPRTKTKWRERDAALRTRMAELLAQGAYSQQQARKLAAWDPYDQNAHAGFFDAEWMFGVTDGFDIVIGNPPYRLLQPHNTAQSELDYFRGHYVSADFKIELFHLFLQRGTSLLHDSGCLGFIVPGTLLNNVYAEKLRRWLMDHCAIKTIAVSPMHVFAEADVHTSVVVFKREKERANREKNFVAITAALTPEFARSPGEYGRMLQARFAALPGGVWNILLNEGNIGLIEKLRKAGPPLESTSKINRGLVTGDRARYFSEKKLTEKHVPILTGADVERYSTKPPAEFVLFDRPESAGGCWDEDVHLAPHKLVVRQIGTKPMASFIAKPIAVTANIFTIRGESKTHELFLLGIVNSKLIEFFWKIMFSDFKSSFPQVTIFSLSQVPVVDTRENDKGLDTVRDRVVALVDQILAAKRADAGADTSAPEAEIDRHVYALYGLTPAEIKLVEGHPA